MLKYSIILLFVCISPVLLNAQIDVSFTFSPDSACSGTQIQFTSTVTGGNPSNYIYSWDFGDGLNSYIANPNHVFDAFSCYERQFYVVLIVTDTSNNTSISDTVDSFVNVQPKPNPQFVDSHNDANFSNCDNDPTEANPDFIITLQNITPNSGCITTYTINWGDGSPLVTGLTNNSFPLDYTYTKLGAFNLTITAYGTNGCNGVTTYVVKNQSNPAVGLSTEGSTQGCAPRTYSFNLFKDELNSPGTTYLWDFGDNSPNVLWTKDSVLVNKGIISHTFTTTSCGNPNNEFVVTVTASNSCSSTSATVSGIKIWSSPSADFIFSPSQGCVNTTQFCFPNTTVPGAFGSSCSTSTNYLWDFGNGQTSTNAIAPCQTYPTGGAYSITLTASNGCGSSTITKQISVQNPPDAIAVADKNTGCVPLNVHVTNNSIGTSIQYTWSVSPALGWGFTNGTNKNSQNPDLLFTNVGTYTVTLDVVNACGSDKKVFTITANGIPSISIPTIPDDCLPYTFRGNATYLNNGSNITSFLWSVSPTTGWNFVSPSNTGSQNPTILFSQAGDYQITVQATNGCGTVSKTSNQFRVFPFVQVTAGNDTLVCINSGSFQLRGNPTGGGWSGTNVTSTGVFSPTAAGIFSLIYTKGTGNCQTKDEVIVTVAPRPNVDAGINITQCINSGLLTLKGTPSGGTWSGTGITNSITGIFNPAISGTGSFSITYTYTDVTTKCSNTDNILITVLPIPDVVANDATFCNQPIAEQLIATPAGGQWSGPNVTPSGLFTPNGTGTFVLTYTYTDNIGGCSNSDPMTVTVINPSIVKAGNDTSICSNENIILVGYPKGGTWSGSNVTTDGLFDPVSAGNYSLEYSIGTGSCRTTDNILVVVKSSPTAAFTSTIICFGETTVFTDQSLGGGVNMAKWLWEFGDNNTSQLQNPSHYYLAPGTYITTLLVQNENSCKDSITRPINVMELPKVNFDYTKPACLNVPVSFNNNSSNAQSYIWNFGDGNISTLSEPNHIYLKEGLYQIKLTARSGFGCTYSDSSEITITGPPPRPYFQISKKEGCSPVTSYISIDSSRYDQTSSYYWDFGNGLTSNSLIPPDSLFYKGSLTDDTVFHIRFVSYNFCDSLVYSESILVHPQPLTQFEMIHDWDCTPVEVHLKNVSRGKPESFYWDLGDGTTSTEFEPLHTYTTGVSSSIYQISLISRNKCGIDTLTRNLLIKPNTVDAFFTVNNFKGCEGDAFCFQNYSSDTSGVGISNLSWNFGDGQGSSAENPCHVFKQVGIYTVKLQVDNGCGRDETYDTIVINPTPLIEIHVNNEACVGEALSFNFSTNVEIAGKKWYFGDGDSSLLSNPYHSYKQAGTYEVMLTGVSVNGFPACVGVVNKQVVIKPTPDSFILSDTSGCAPLEITFQGDPGSNHVWNFGDNTPITTNPTHVFNSPGLFMVKLISQNSSMCRDSDSVEIRVFPSPESQFTFTSSGGYPEYLTFVNSSTGATECFWDFDNGHVLPSCEVNGPIEYRYNDNYIITLQTLNEYGCEDTHAESYLINFKGLFVPNALIPEAPDPDENLFLPKGIGIMEYTIQIYDTWGNLIWQSSALEDGMPSEGWNGRDKDGKLYPQDVYVWRASAKFTDGTNWSGKNGETYGTVTLIR